MPGGAGDLPTGPEAGPPPRKTTRGTCNGRPCSSSPNNNTTQGSKKKAMEKPETVLFLPATADSRLRKKLQEQDNKFSAVHGVPPVRFVEHGGKKVSQVLGTSDPWGGVHCGRPNCVPCSDPMKDDKMAAPRGACTSESCLYSLECILCEIQEPKVTTHYYGESGRSGFTRGKEHHDKIATGDMEHPIIKHMIEHHAKEDAPVYRMRIMRKFIKPMQRQVAEGVAIENSKANIRLNSKGEWHSARIPHLQVEVGTKVIHQGDYRGPQQPWRPLPQPGSQPKRKNQSPQEEQRQDKRKKRRMSTLAAPQQPQMDQENPTPPLDTHQNVSPTMVPTHDPMPQNHPTPDSASQKSPTATPILAPTPAHVNMNPPTMPMDPRSPPLRPPSWPPPMSLCP